MSWNDSNGNDQDPWKNKGNNQGPPDLDEVVRRMQEKLSSIFGGGGKGKGKGKGSGNAGNSGTFLVVSIILLGLLAWEMVYRIDPAERGEPGFNEFYYLLHNNKAKEAVLNRTYENGLEHYIAVGKALGYKINAN